MKRTRLFLPFLFTNSNLTMILGTLHHSFPGGALLSVIKKSPKRIFSNYKHNRFVYVFSRDNLLFSSNLTLAFFFLESVRWLSFSKESRLFGFSLLSSDGFVLPVSTNSSFDRLFFSCRFSFLWGESLGAIELFRLR